MPGPMYIKGDRGRTYFSLCGGGGPYPYSRTLSSASYTQLHRQSFVAIRGNSKHNPKQLSMPSQVTFNKTTSKPPACPARCPSLQVGLTLPFPGATNCNTKFKINIGSQWSISHKSPSRVL